MHVVRSFLLSSLASLPLVAQAPSPSKHAPEPVDKSLPSEATRPGVVLPQALARSEAKVPTLPRLPATVRFDVDADGGHWAHAPGWKAHADGRALLFVPFLGSDAPANQPLRLELTDVRVGERSLPVPAGSVVRTEQRWTVVRGACREHFDLQLGGVEQSWEFAELPTRGELRLSLAMTTSLRGEDLGADLVFTGPRGGVRYGAAVAIDAAGRRCPLALDLRGDRIELVVPADFVASATLPLVVDPLASTVLVSATQAYQGNASIAFDYSTQQFLVVWENAFSATDLDVWAQRLDLQQVPIGVPFQIDFSTVSWARPRVANNGQADNFLVVAECSNAFASPRWIGGRLFATSTGTSPSFVIERAGVGGSFSGDALRPDVGGDPAETGTTWYTVVWEREYSTTDHDILLRQVSPIGTLRTFSPIVIDTATSYESLPRIAKSNGYTFTGNPGVQYWPIVYQRTFGPGDEDVRGSIVDANGQFVGAANFPIATSSRDERTPVVSSPTDDTAGPRRHAVAFTRLEPTTSTDILVSICDATGGLLTTTNLQLAEGAGAAEAWQQIVPVIDSDGSRFAIAYKELWSGTGGDFDVRVSTLAHDPAANTTAVHDSRASIAGSSNYEGEPAIASTWSGGGGSLRYGIAWQQYSTTGPTHNVFASVYDGHLAGPLPTVRSTACSGLGISLSGLPGLGRVLQFDQTDAGPLSGFSFGTPVNVPLSFCPGCTLGVDGVLLPNPFAIVIPANPALVGASFAAQAFSLYSGTCLGSIALSDTIDLTLL